LNIGKGKNFLYFQKHRIQWVTGFFLGIKPPEREVNYPPASTDEGKNEWSYIQYTSTALI